MERMDLNAGFTGDLTKKDRAGERAKKVVSRVKDETGMMAAHAADHPVATGSAMLAVGLIGLMAGYLLGSGSSAYGRSWRG